MTFNVISGGAIGNYVCRYQFPNHTKQKILKNPWIFGYFLKCAVGLTVQNTLTMKSSHGPLGFLLCPGNPASAVSPLGYQYPHPCCIPKAKVAKGTPGVGLVVVVVVVVLCFMRLQASRSCSTIQSHAAGTSNLVVALTRPAYAG
jgi:hypothetical protein